MHHVMSIKYLVSLIIIPNAIGTVTVHLIPLCTGIQLHHSIQEQVDSHLTETCSSLDLQVGTPLQQTSSTNT